MQKNALDKFFRDKLEQPGSTSFDPAHWEEAKKMLAKDKKDRKAFYWVFSALALILVLGAGGIYLKQNNSENSKIPSSKDKRQEYKIEMTETESIEIDNKSLVKDEQVKTSENETKKGESAALKSQAKKSSSVKQNVWLVDNVSKIEKGILETNSSLTQTESYLEGSEITVHESRATAIPDLLSTPAYSLNYVRELSPGKDLLPLDRALKISRRRLAWSGTVLVDPAFSNVSPAKGLIVGITYEQYLNTHWLIGARPSLQLRAGEDGFSKFEQITTYGFSASKTTYGLKANNLQFFSLPAYFGAEFKSHTFELGLSVDLLLAARGQLQQIAVEDRSVVNLQNLNSGWIDTQHMQKLSTNLFFGYKNSLTNRLKTGITIFYNPTKIYPGLPNNQNQIINSKWYLGWQATYYIK